MLIPGSESSRGFRDQWLTMAHKALHTIWCWPPFWCHLMFFPRVLLAPVPLTSLLILNIPSFSCFRAFALMTFSVWNICPLGVSVALPLIPSRPWPQTHFITKASQYSTSDVLRELWAFVLFNVLSYRILLQNNVFIYGAKNVVLFPSLSLVPQKVPGMWYRYAVNIVK